MQLWAQMVLLNESKSFWFIRQIASNNTFIFIYTGEWIIYHIFVRIKWYVEHERLGHILWKLLISKGSCPMHYRRKSPGISWRKITRKSMCIALEVLMWPKARISQLKMIVSRRTRGALHSQIFKSKIVLMAPLFGRNHFSSKSHEVGPPLCQLLHNSPTKL